jgi:hypothetical protein
MFIYTTKTMFPSAKALANSLSAKLGRKVYVTTNPDTSLYYRHGLIRWGNGSAIKHAEDIPSLYIRASANKLLFSTKMIEFGVPVVQIQSGIPERFPVVIRRTLTGYGGAGIELCTSFEDFLLDYYEEPIHWSYYRVFHPELGVHIFNGKIIKLFKKVWKGEGAEPAYPIRNASRGYHFQRVELENFPSLIPFVENFYSKFPIMFGRLDIGWDYDEKTYRVIEMNTAPGLVNNPDTLEAYTNAFLEVL